MGAFASAELSGPEQGPESRVHLDGSVTGPGHPQASTGCVGCMARLTDPRIDLGRAFSGSERLSGAFSVETVDGGT